MRRDQTTFMLNFVGSRSKSWRVNKKSILSCLGDSAQCKTSLFFQECVLHFAFIDARALMLITFVLLLLNTTSNFCHA